MPEYESFSPEKLAKTRKLSPEEVAALFGQIKSPSFPESSFSETSPSEERISLDFESIKSYWITFYAKYGIDTSSISNLSLTPEAIKEALDAIKEYGFDKIAIIPDLSFQELAEDSAYETFRTFSDSNAPKDQNTGTNGAIWIDDTIKNHASFKRKPTFRVVFFKDKTGRVDTIDTATDYTIQKIQREQPELLHNKPDTRNQTYPALKEMEGYLGLEGFDLTTALILDREHYDRTASHLFEYQKKNGIFLTSTANEYGADRCAGLRWNPGPRRWDVNLWASGDAYPYIGAGFLRSLDYTES